MWRRLLSQKSPKYDNQPDPRDPSATATSQLSDSSSSPQRGRISKSSNPQDAVWRPSQINPFSSYRDRSPKPDQRLADTLGLQVIYQPSSTALLDIVFVHGLGGASHKTWTKYQDPHLFWPQQWLPLEPEICTARILSFGYNASFRPGGPRNIANIADFAKDLLFEMRFGKDDNTEDLGIGRVGEESILVFKRAKFKKVPIIFVAHSMGGLVVKKAYILGQNDEDYQVIVNSISGVLFLATPHRGTHLAEVLNKILTVSFQSPKKFIVELNKSSPALEDINEQFRHIAPKISIVSFYETLYTTVGLKKLLVLEKDSSILGYPGEISKSLNADHHDVCKYTSQDDPNYISVRNALKFLVGQFGSKGACFSYTRWSEESREIEMLFSGSQNPEDDFKFFRQRWISGTCEWVLSEPTFKLWLAETPEPRIAWLNAPPASGKSILSTHVINYVRSIGYDCQYFFFRFGDQTKQSANSLLRSLGFQIARDVPAFRQKLTKLLSEGIKLEKIDARIIWQMIFVSVLSKLALPKPLYWVIDGLDESDSSQVLLELLQSISDFRTPVRVFFISRSTESLSLAFEKLAVSVPVDVIQKDSQKHVFSDISIYVEKEIRYMRGSADFKRQISESILRRAEGNFLWVHLVLEEILSCHTEQDIQRTLEDVPAGMGALYHRMQLAIAENPRHADRILANTILTWTICAHRSLTLEELSQALMPEFPEFLDLKSTIQDVCGQFIVVDQQSHVVMVHQTARDYLTKTPDLQFSINLTESHSELFAKTLSYLLQPDIRTRLGRGQHMIQTTEPFLIYAAISWTYHLRQTVTIPEDTLGLLFKFFKGPYVLGWIQSLALFGQLEALVKAARVLTWFVGLNRKLNVETNPLLHRLRDLELLELWATDLVKLVGKFGRHLLLDATVIYKIIPPFCPHDSIIYRQFNHNYPSGLSISGFSNTTWNDCLARISLGNGANAWKITCAGSHFAVLSSAGTVYLWNSVNFEETCRLRHAEYITTMCFNSRGDRFVSYGLKTTKVWAIPSGQLLTSIPNPTDIKALAIAFAEDDTRILVGSSDRIIRDLCVRDADGAWEVLNTALSKETTQINGGYISSPSSMAFNADATQIAVAYRGYPLSVWFTHEPLLIGRCKRVFEHRPNHGCPSVSWMAVDRVTWNHVTGHLLGLYKDGCIFKWHPATDENQEVRATADEIEASPDGRLFVTSDTNGTVKIWDFAFFSVLYQLSSENLVADLAFSPDCRRFYDLRGSSINAWEPNSLIRLSDIEDTFNNNASEDQTPKSIPQASEAWVVPIDHICALSAAPKSSLYCVSKEEGAVDLFDTSKGKLLELVNSLNFLTVDHLTWGGDGKHVAAADLGGNVVVKRILSIPSKTRNPYLEAQSIFSAKVDINLGSIHQIVLNQDSTKLLIIGQDFGQTWSVEKGCIIATSVFGKRGSYRWVTHPLQNDLLLGIGNGGMKVIRWNDSTEVGCLEFRKNWSVSQGRSNFDTEEAGNTSVAQLSLGPGDESITDVSVDKVMLTQDGKHLLTQFSEVTPQGRSTKHTLIFATSSLELSHSSTPLNALDIPKEILAGVEVPLGVLSAGRFVFLDRDLWMCTWKLGSVDGDPDALKRHYFIPRDWASTECLNQCCMLEDGTFLCPTDGEVGVITSNLGAGGW